MNPAGAMFDAQAFDDQRSITPAWEGITEVRTSINDTSWVAEIAIPVNQRVDSRSLGSQVAISCRRLTGKIEALKKSLPVCRHLVWIGFPELILLFQPLWTDIAGYTH